MCSPTVDSCRGGSTGGGASSYSLPHDFNLANRAIVSSANPQKIWEDVADVTGQYFEIKKEEPCRLIDGVISPGYIETRPLPGATIFEPWKGDSVGSFQRWESTLQSIRRKGLIRVSPEGTNQYSIEVFVYKELENVPGAIDAQTIASEYVQPGQQQGNARSINSRNDQSAWINMGRDSQLEQKILQEIIAASRRCQ